MNPAKAPHGPATKALLALHVALNSPVVALDRLPVGPASAAVALHPGPPPGVTLAVRSVRSGQTVFFTSGDLLADRPDVALDAALSFAEGLGFLFDDDEVPARGAGEATQLWIELCGEDGPEPEAAPALRPVPAVEHTTEPAAEAAPPALLLSKFRRLAPAEAELRAAAERAVEAGAPPPPETDLCMRRMSRF